MNTSILQRVFADMAEDNSPNRRERTAQALKDVKDDIQSRSERIVMIQRKVQDICDLLESLRDDQSPKAILLRSLLLRRRDTLEEEAETINLAKMMKKMEGLQRELEDIDWCSQVMCLFIGENNG